ncbi:hypothetical protein RFI_24195 [Reticulomyxa filosa]|uniref:Uncharacterized protein n=1 Tax=Reticulomyxa filosa TaxID=46433 RepID=X6MHM7_RETFI|nr:hypothetical protein RFI_24195 [Reticulomyxa filosa]|eukprot:ETO13181.1 hypothetical protein RFI_24195 [Reticulomyxa filosa]
MTQYACFFICKICYNLTGTQRICTFDIFFACMLVKSVQKKKKKKEMATKKEGEIEESASPRRSRPLAKNYRGISLASLSETVEESNKLENVKALNATVSNVQPSENLIEINLQSKGQSKESSKELSELQIRMLEDFDKKEEEKAEQKKKEEEEEEEEENDDEKSGPFPRFHGEDVDRLMNFITHKMSQEKLVEKMSLLMAEFNKNTDKFMYGKTPKALTYELVHNCFHCRIKLDDFKTCEFTITMYAYSNNCFLLDIHELFGEHFTFNRFLQDFKSALQEHEIAKIPKFSQVFFLFIYFYFLE